MKLIIFSGLPGAGKSTLAEETARKLGIPVFAKDWLEASLLTSEMSPANPQKPLGSAGYQLLSMLARRQLLLGQSAILDSVASTLSIRAAWRELARQFGADWRVIECVCSDENLHRSRLSARKREIPGWPELEWSEVQRVKSYYAAWDEAHLVLDTVEPFEQNLLKALTYCS